MKKIAPVKKTNCFFRFLFLAVVFMITSAVEAQLNESWVATPNLASGAPTGAKSDVWIMSDGNIVVSGGNAIIKYGTGGNQLWAKTLTFPTGYLPGSIAFAADDDGNIYVTATNSSGNAGFVGDLDVYVAKYNASGILQWSTWHDGPLGTDDVAKGIATDIFGNVYITGITFISQYQWKTITLKYNTAGTFQWQTTYDDNVTNSPNAITTDYYTGEVYVAGYSKVPGNNTDFTTIKYNTNGGQEWINLFNGNSEFSQSDEANAIAVDLDGNVIVTGFVTNKFVGSSSSQDVKLYATFKYDRITGAEIWKKGYGNNQSEGDGYFNSKATALAVDGAGNVIVTGESELSSDGSKEIATIKYKKADGDAAWVRRYNNAAYIQEDIFDDDNDVATAVGIDAFGNAYVTGYSKDNGTLYDYVTIKYNGSNGTDAGFARLHVSGDDRPGDIAVHPGGTAYVTGFTRFPTTRLTTVKYGICSIICPSNITSNNASGQCGAVIHYNAATTTGDCGALQYSQASGTFFPVGVTTISVTSASTGESCSFTVTVNDVEPPVITCPSSFTFGCAANVPPVTINSVIANDNCGSTTVTHVSDVISNQTCANRFTLTRTYKAMDASGNSATCTQLIVVNDVTPPLIVGLNATPQTLSPPNHSMRDVVVNYQINDNCVTPPNIMISVSSNEPVNGTGDGDTDTDWEIIDNHHVRLRAERAANGNGRIYTIKITVTDGCNPPVTSSTQVVVAHNIKGPMSGNPFKIGTNVDFSGTFWDKPGNTHIAKWLTDGSVASSGLVTEPVGIQNGKVTGSYKFNTAGVYKLQMNVTDQTGVTSYANTNADLDAIVVIYDPNGGNTFGGGWYPSPLGALKSNSSATGKASFGFAVNYRNASKPKGETQFEFKVGEFEFNALNFDYLAINNAKAQFKGTGKIVGGQSGIGFIMTVIDGALNGTGVDKIRMKIYNRNTGYVYYDNQPGASDADDPAIVVGTNSVIVIQGTPPASATRAIEITQLSDEKKGLKKEKLYDKLELVAYPNPSNKHFTVQAASDDVKTKIQMQVSDQHGRLLEKRDHITVGSVIQLGELYRPGIYYVRIVQGKNHKELKLIKLP